MKRFRGTWTALGLLLGATALAGCSSTGGEETVTELPDDPSAEGTDLSEISPGEKTAGDQPVAILHELEPAPAVEPGPGQDEDPLADTVAYVTGNITDIGADLSMLGLGGQGTLAGAATVRLSSIIEGDVEVIADVAVDASGRFAAKVPLNLDLVIAEVLDVSGRVLGATLVGGSGATAGATIAAAPVTLETSLEVQVLLRALQCSTGHGRPHRPLLELDVLAMIDAGVAAAVASSVAAGADLDLLIDALANASVAAGRARVRALVDAGVDLNVDALVNAKLEALARLNAGLVAALNGQASLARVTADLLADVNGVLSAAASTEVSASVKARAQAAASLAFSGALSASLVAVAHVDALTFAALRAAARLEAELCATLVADLIRVSGGSQAAVDLAVNAGVKLVADVSTATTLQGLSNARAAYMTTLHGGANASAGLVGDVLLGATGTAVGLLGGVLDTVGDLTGTLNAALAAELSAAVDLNLCLDVEAEVSADVKLDAVITALATFCTDLRALGPSLQNGTTAQVSADALVELLSTAGVLLRVQS